MDNYQEFVDAVNFSASELALGRQRRRKWVSLITQQLRLRHVYQIYVYNIQDDQKAPFYFTLHSTPLSSPFYTSEKAFGKHPKWNELLLNGPLNTSSVVFRVWKCTEDGDRILLTWGVNFSGLVYLGNKIADLQPKYFKANTVIFFMQGVYFTSQSCLQSDLDRPLPFLKNLNLIETNWNEQVLYRKVAVKVPKGEISISYTLDKLRRLQELQRKLKNMKTNVQHLKGKIKSATERDAKEDAPPDSQVSRFAPQLLTMNSLNKMLYEKPTRAQREQMLNTSKKIEVSRFRLRLLHQEKDKKSANMRKLRRQEAKLIEENEERNSNLMSLYHSLSKESHQWDQHSQGLLRRREVLLIFGEQLFSRQCELLKELLFIYPIDKLPNENKYTMLGIHLPNSELLLDYQDSGVSVVLGYICHILIMCSIFLQVPLRHPMKHFGSRSVIYDQVHPDLPDKEREFPLYTKGRDRAQFSYAVFLLNKNISQMRWHLHHKPTVDLKETLKHLRSLLLGDDLSERRHVLRPPATVRTGDSASSLDMLVSPSIFSFSSSSLNDPLLDRAGDEIKEERRSMEPLMVLNSKKRLGLLRPRSPKQSKKERQSKTSSEILAVPEAYLNRQISKDLFQRCASDGYKLGLVGKEEDPIEIRQGFEEVEANDARTSGHSDSIEEGTDPLDPSTNLDSLITKSIDIKREPQPNQSNCSNRISRSMDSYMESETSRLGELSSDPQISASCDKTDQGQQGLLEQWLTGTHIAPNDLFSQEYLRVSLQDISSPLTERTDRLLSTNQSFNLVKHRPIE